VIKYENINIRGIEQGYGIRLYLKLMMKKLKLIRVLPLFVPFWGLSSKKLPWRFPCAHVPRNFFEKLLNYKTTMSILGFT